MKRSAGMSGAFLLGDQGVGVGRVADHEHLDVGRGTGVERLALRAEDAAVGRQQIAALHARGARPGADEQRDVGAVERLGRVIGDVDAGEQRERAVVELHRGALGGLQRRGDLEQREPDRHIGAEQLPGRDAEEQRVTDLTGRAGDRDLDRGGSHAAELLVVEVRAYQWRTCERPRVRWRPRPLPRLPNGPSHQLRGSGTWKVTARIVAPSSVMVATSETFGYAPRADPPGRPGAAAGWAAPASSEIPVMLSPCFQWSCATSARPHQHAEEHQEERQLPRPLRHPPGPPGARRLRARGGTARSCRGA